MKKLLLLLLSLLFVPYAYSQSAFSILKLAAKGSKGAIVCRTLSTAPKNAKLVQKVISSQNVQRASRSLVGGCELEVTIEFTVPLLSAPENIYGGYNYLRTISRLSRNKGAVNKAYVSAWKNIAKNSSYNGAHHIVNKSTLKEIHHAMKAQYKARGQAFTISLEEMQRNAPAIFHKLHGHPAYKDLFHNSAKQLELYEKGGIRKVLDYFFLQTKLISSSSMGTIPQYSAEVIRGTYLEAELWAKTFHLRW